MSRLQGFSSNCSESFGLPNKDWLVPRHGTRTGLRDATVGAQILGTKPTTVTAPNRNGSTKSSILILAPNPFPYPSCTRQLWLARTNATLDKSLDVSCQTGLISTFLIMATIAGQRTKHINIYNPLPEGAFIRILVLKPGRHGQPLRCQVKMVNLKENPDFKAISYI